MALRRFFLCDGRPVGDLGDLERWLREANFEGKMGSIGDLLEHVNDVREWREDVLLFLAVPKRLAAARDSIQKLMNLRQHNSLCVLLVYSESCGNSPDPSVRFEFHDILPDKLNAMDRHQDRAFRTYRHSKAEFAYVVVSDLERLLSLWRSLQLTWDHDLASLLKEAGKDEQALEHVEMTAMTGKTSLSVAFSPPCGECSFLENAVRMGHLTCLQHLLASGAGAKSDTELSPLHLAVLKAGQKNLEVYSKMAKLLLAAKHDPRLLTSNGVTPLHWAAGYGQAALVSTMLHLIGTGELTWEAKKDPYNGEVLEKMGKLANIQDRSGRTALYRAVMHCHEECVRWLTQMSADCNLCDANGCSPLHLALQQKPREGLVTMLLEAGALVDAVDADGRLPLHFMAAHRTHSERLLRRLLPTSAGVDRDGWTPLHEAALSGNAALLKELLEHVPQSALSIADAKVPHILHVALMGKNLECVELLVSAKASPLQFACLTWDEENFWIQRHYTEVGLCLMSSGILAFPFDRILFKTDVDPAEFHRNVSTKLRDLQRNPDRSELKVLHARELTQDQCEIIFSEARRLGMSCIPPGELKEDGSRQPLIVYKLGSLVHSKRVLQDIELRQRVQSRLADMDPGDECHFRDMSSFQRRLVHEVASDLGLHSRSEGQDVRVRKALAQRMKRPRAEKDDDFLQELRQDLDCLKEGDEMHLGYGLSSYRRRMLHQEVEKRGWSSLADGSSILVRHVYNEPRAEKVCEEEYKEQVHQQLELLKPGESHTFPATLNSFERRIVHQVAEELGWAHETIDLEDQKGKGKGKSKGKGKGKGGKGHKGKGSKGERQITVTNASGAVREGESVETEVSKVLERLSQDQSLHEHPFEWEVEGRGMGRRAAIRRAVAEALDRWPLELDLVNERQGNKLRLVLRRKGEQRHAGMEGLPDNRFDCLRIIRKDIYQFICSSEQELEYPVTLTKMQRSVIHEVARQFRLVSTTKGIRRAEQVVVNKTSSGNPSEPLVLHEGFLCDGCQAVPQGLRFHCQQCEDFDFCNSCHEAWSQGSLPHATDHTFQPVQAIPEVKKATRVNALQLAAGMGLSDALKVLLREIDPAQLLHSKTNMGDTSLHLACNRRRRQAIQDLLEAKADCNAQNSKGRSSLHIISRIPSFKSSDSDELAGIMQTLLDAAGDPTILENNGDSPLHQASVFKASVWHCMALFLFCEKLSSQICM